MPAINSTEIKPKSRHGGKRPGAGRKPGSRNVASDGEVKSIGAAARVHGRLALNTLVAIAKKGESEAARVSAAIHILDRGYGKATEHHEITGKDEGAILVQQETTIEERSANDLARRVAFLLSKGRREVKAKG